MVIMTYVMCHVLLFLPFTPFSFLIILILFTVTDFVILMSIAKELDERERVKPLT